MAQFRTLIDIYNSRPDVSDTVKRAFPGQDPFEQGTEANRWLNNWWNTVHEAEFPDVELVDESAPELQQQQTIPTQTEQTQTTQTTQTQPTSTTGTDVKTIYNDFETFKKAFESKTGDPLDAVVSDEQAYWEQRKQFPDWMKDLETFAITPTPTQLADTTQTKTTTDPQAQDVGGTPSNILAPQFTQAGFQQRTIDELGVWHQELQDNQNLYQVYLDRPDLQEVFGADLQGKVGTDWEGFNMSFWANQWGWREEPNQLEAYKPENFVRTRYAFGFRLEDREGFD